MAEISEKIGCSENKVVYWMKKYGIKRRSRRDASYKKHNPDGDLFNIKNNLSLKENILYGLGMGIYLGEGNKTSQYSVSVANTNPLILNVFLEFLFEICRVKKERVHYSIVCFNDTSPQKSKNYWKANLKTSPTNFGKIVQIPPQGKGSYKRKSKFGVCTVTISNTKLKKWLIEEIKKLNIKAGIV